MSLFGRYVFGQIASSFLMIMVSLTMIVWVAIALKDLNLLTSQGQGVVLFLKMTMLALPNIMALIAPNAMLIASLFVFDRLNNDSELIIMSASGAPIWHFATPLLVITGVLSVVLLVMSLYIQPLSLRTLKGFITQVRTDLIAQVLQPGRFSSPERGLTFHIRDRAPNQDLLGMLVHDTRTQGRTVTYLAERGKIVSADGGSYLIMQDGQIHSSSDDDAGNRGEVKIGEFSEYIFDLSQFQPKTGVAEYKPQERYLSELLNPGPDDSYYKRTPGKFRSEIHERFATPLYPFVYAMITLAMLAQARTIRENKWKSLALAFALCVGVRFAGLAGTNLLTLHAWAVVLVYGIPLSAILVAAAAAQVRMAPYARFKLGLEIPAKLQFNNNNLWTALGVRIEQLRGRVG